MTSVTKDYIIRYQDVFGVWLKDKFTGNEKELSEYLKILERNGNNHITPITPEEDFFLMDGILD